ncbi:MAG: hypothetical protein ACE5H9_06145 [Anaerolineae bacterium]
MTNRMKSNSLDRRRFLQGAGLLGLLAFLDACQLLPRPDGPQAARHISTSVPTRTPLAGSTRAPTATPTATGTRPPPAPTDTPSATSTPEPTGGESPLPTPEEATATSSSAPTDTPEPTPTPTPTPYPPGPPSKLGLFITRNLAEVLRLIEVGRPPLVKTLELDPNFAKGIKELAPKALLIGRFELDQLNLDADPLPLARAFVERLLPIATEPTRMEHFDAWEGFNEPVADTPDKMKRLADFEAERTRLLAEQGVKSVVGNFATGHPPLELWPDFAPALAAIRQYGGYLGLHEYSAPIMQFGTGALQLNNGPDQGDEGWFTLRYRKAYRQHLIPMGYGDIPLLMTECGIDGLIHPRPGPPEAQGWQDFVSTWIANGLRDDGPGVYMDQLIWYDEELRQDDYVKGAAIFIAGGSSQWQSYDILGRTAELLQQYLAVHPQF